MAVLEQSTKNVPFSRKVAKQLLEIEAVKLNVSNPFTWTSGIKSPIYCDNRVINSRVEVRDNVISVLSNIISANYPDVEIIAGVATGGIPYGVLVADRLKLPFIYVREERKQYGLMKRVEGEFEKGNKVVLIEDHISTGGSSMKAIGGLREEGLELLALVSIMTYGFKKAENLYRQEDVQYKSICNLDTILEVALEEEIITQDEKDLILEFRDSPNDWRPK